MLDPGDHTAQQPETLRAGPSRPSLLQKVPARWRQPAALVLVLALGVAIGAGAVVGWQDPHRPAPPEFHADEHAVELLLFEVAPLRTRSGGSESEDGRLEVDSAVVLSGAVTSTVLGVQILDRSLDVRIPALPVTISPTARFQSVQLEIIIRDCTAATRWTPDDRPFTITWRDEHGKSHLDRAGDFDRSMARSLTRHIDAVCGKAARRD